MAMITPRDEADIVFYFSAQSMFERSTSGTMLERARNASCDSDGKKFPPDYRAWNWQPGEDDSPPMQIHKHSGDQEQGYTVDDDALMRFARVSRRMAHVERTSPAVKRTLEAYYGDRGARWASLSGDDKQGTKVVRKGVGPGAIASLYALTPLGVTFVAKERERALVRAKGAALPRLSDDDVLVSAFTVQAVKADQVRALHLAKVRDEAEALLTAARAAWMVAPRFSREKSPGGRQSGTYRDGYGAVVTWIYTRDQHDRDCRHCAAGTCEQRIETSPSWHSARVIHNEARSGLEVA